MPRSSNSNSRPRKIINQGPSAITRQTACSFSPYFCSGSFLLGVCRLIKKRQDLFQSYVMVRNTNKASHIFYYYTEESHCVLQLAGHDRDHDCFAPVTHFKPNYSVSHFQYFCQSHLPYQIMHACKRQKTHFLAFILGHFK